MVSSIVNLKRILAIESSKSSKNIFIGQNIDFTKSMTMTLKVFKKLSSLMLTKADNTTIDVAVRMYHEAVRPRSIPNRSTWTTRPFDRLKITPLRVSSRKLAKPLGKTGSSTRIRLT